MIKVTKGRLYDSRVRDHVILHLGLNVSSSAYNCGCVVNAIMLWQQFEYYYYYYYNYNYYVKLYYYKSKYKVKKTNVSKLSTTHKTNIRSDL